MNNTMNKEKSQLRNSLLTSIEFIKKPLSDKKFVFKEGDYIQDKIKIVREIFNDFNTSCKFFLVFHEEINENLIIKVIKISNTNKNDMDKIDKIISEFDNISLIPPDTSNNIIRYYDLNILDENLYLLMPYLKDYISLHHYLYGLNRTNVKKKGLKRKEIRILVIGILKGLDCLHKNDVIHARLNTDNVLISKDFSSIKLINYSCRLNEKEVSKFPYYSSPELCENKNIDYETDIWSVGCIIYELLTGYKPYHTMKEGDAFYHIIQTCTPFEAAGDDIKDILFDKNNRQCLNLMNKCFRCNKGTRPSAEKLLEDDFLNGNKETEREGFL